MKRLTHIAVAVLLGAALAACGSDKDENSTYGEAGGGPGAGTGVDSGMNGANGSGIAAGDLPAEVAELKSQVGDTIHFDLNSDAINAEANQILQRQAAYMQKYPNLTFTIEGNCDERGTREFNLALGQRRAEAAKTALVALGIQPQRLQTISYGKERPVAVGSNEAAWAQNRRDTTVVN
jgi:peptidoglycan-associated lipoprotein